MSIFRKNKNRQVFYVKMQHNKIEVNMINVTIPQKDVILAYFKDEFTIVTRYAKMISPDMDINFKYFVFKDFIFSAAGMMKDIDQNLYNDKLIKPFGAIKSLDKSYNNFQAKSKHVLTVYINEFLKWQNDYVSQKKRYEDLQAELQMLISSEKVLSNKFKVILQHIKEITDKDSKAEVPQALTGKQKSVRAEHVDIIHLLGQRRQEIEELQKLLSNFEEEHKALFQEYFKAITTKLDSEYVRSLSFFGYKFNKKLFSDAQKSTEVQKFRQRAHIFGDLDLCKYVEYYLKNVSTDDLSDPKKKERLNEAKQYCKNKREQENLF